MAATASPVAVWKPFKQQFSFDKRKTEADRIRLRYPNRIPIIVELAEKSTLPDVDKHKYLVPTDLTMAQFTYVLRKRIRLRPEEAIFTFINNRLTPAHATLAQVYAESKDADGFVYVTYTSENSFGSLG